MINKGRLQGLPFSLEENMSRLLTCPVPSNISPLSPNGYNFSIQRLPELSYFCQEVTLPALTLSTIEIGTPFVKYPVAGDLLDFGELTVQFLVDSNMLNYRALFKWIRGMGFPESYSQYIGETASSNSISEVAASLSDATLSILGPNSTPVQTITFKDCSISSLSSLTFTAISQDVEYLVGTATFRYAYYDFEELIV